MALTGDTTHFFSIMEHVLSFSITNKMGQPEISIILQEVEHSAAMLVTMNPANGNQFMLLYFLQLQANGFLPQRTIQESHGSGGL